MMNADTRLQALQSRYQTSLPNKRASVELAWRALCADSTDPARLESLARLVHRLAGSAGSYGYREIGEIAGSADALLEKLGRLDEPEPSPADCCSILDGLTPLIASLLQAMERASATPGRWHATH
jgi:HPt (histidine-containing phosphotransfer) domain-containing protein